MKAALLLTALLAFPAVLRADPIPLTGGSFLQWYDPAGGTLIGQDLELSIATQPMGALFYAPGSVVDFSGLVGVLWGWSSGTSTVNGQTFAGIDTSGSLQITATPVVLELGETLTPFTLTGSVTGHPTPWSRPDGPDPLFSMDVTGQGMLGAQVTQIEVNGQPLYRVDQIGYGLTESQPLSHNPEPISVLLLGIGGSVLGLVRKYYVV